MLSTGKISEKCPTKGVAGLSKSLCADEPVSSTEQGEWMDVCDLVGLRCEQANLRDVLQDITVERVDHVRLHKPMGRGLLG